jgi:beta-glucanase (GH16 family)
VTARSPTTTANDAVPITATTAPRRLLFDDEFDGSAGGLPSGSAWDPQEGAGWGTGQLQSYTARTANVKLDGAGNLALTARKESYRGDDGQAVGYTSARLQTKDRFSFTYGRVEARIKVPSGAGLWPAFWMLGDDIYTKGWPEAGEIDVMETIGSLPKELNGTVHAPLGAWSGSADADGTEWTHGEIYTNASSLSDAYHVYAAEWKPEAIDFSIDGKVYFTISKAQMPGGGRWTFDHPNHLLLNLAVGGEWPGAPTSATPFPSTMLVDWVRVYAPQS